MTASSYNHLTFCKVVFLSRLFCPHIGGVETHVARLSRELVARGFRVTVVTEQFDVTLPLEEKIDGIRVVRIPKKHCTSKLGIWSWMIRHMSLFLSADIIHAHDVFWWFLPLRLLLPFKHVFTTFHGYEGALEPTKKAIRSRKVSELLSRGTICIGDWMKKWYGARPDAVNFGAADVSPSPLPRNRRAVFLGRLAEDTGILSYLEGVALLRGKIVLDVYGEGEFVQKVREVAKKYPYITYCGTTNTPKNIFVKYRFAFVSRYLSMIEAMQAGRYVFAHWNIAIKRDYLASFPAISHAFPFTYAEELAQEMGYIFKHPDKERLAVGQAQAWAREQTWDKVADLYEEIWKK